MRTFQQILEAAGYETSAYGMGGAECLSVGLPGNGCLGRLFGDVLVEVKEDERALTAVAFGRMRTDTLGRGVVVYFPGISRV